MTEVRFPNESEDYRKARAELLQAEKELRSSIERVAALRRQLPEGGEIKEDYIFDELQNGEEKQVQMSDLFMNGHDTLFVYSFMYAPDMKSPCAMCSAFLDSFDRQVPHIHQQVSTAVVARNDIHRIHDFATQREWSNLRLLSSANNSYNIDYYAEVDGNQLPIAHVFRRKDGKIYHFWSSELFFDSAIEGGDMRHVDLLWPLWNVLDLTPKGRGGWYPGLEYSER